MKNLSDQPTRPMFVVCTIVLRLMALSDITTVPLISVQQKLGHTAPFLVTRLQWFYFAFQGKPKVKPQGGMT